MALGFRRAPRHVFVTHGEPSAADALRRKIGERFGWSCSVPSTATRSFSTEPVNRSRQSAKKPARTPAYWFSVTLLFG